MTPVIAPAARKPAAAMRASGVTGAKKRVAGAKSKARKAGKHVADELLVAEETPVTVNGSAKRGKRAKTAKKAAKPRAAQAVNGTARRVSGAAGRLNGHAKVVSGGDASGKAKNAGKRPKNGVRKHGKSGTTLGNGVIAESAIHTPVSDRKLIDQALGGVAGAWDVLYHRCHQPLLTAIRAIVGPRSADPNLVDELAARVWYAVVRDQGRLLDRFDPARACTLTTYLALLAKDEASRLFRSEKRRRKRETVVATCDSKVRPKGSLAAGATTITIHEFVATLTPAEKTFYDEITVRNGRPANEKKGPSCAEVAGGNGNTNGRSQANEWQLNHRVRRKLERFLTG